MQAPLKNLSYSFGLGVVFMTGLTYLFPGQGSQKIGMGQDLYVRSSAKAVFEKANSVLNFPLTKLMFEGPKEELQKTCYAQPAILTHSIAMWHCLLEEATPNATFFAGHSLGEYSALVAAGSLSFEDAIQAVHFRGKAMQDAVPLGRGSMAVVLGLAEDKIHEICQEISRQDPRFEVSIANLNGPGQTVISGTVEGIAQANLCLKDAGAKRLMPLPVSAPFHCNLMKPAQDKLAQHLNTIQFLSPQKPLISNVTAQPVTDPLLIRDLLIAQVTKPVRFTEMVEFLQKKEINIFVEVGPGKALVGIVKRMIDNVEIHSMEDLVSLNNFSSAIKASVR